MKYLLLLGFVGVASAVDINGVECPVTDGELGPCCPTGEIEIPVGVTSIGDNAFDECTTITSVTFPEGLTSIGEHAFEGTTFESLVAPSSLTSVNSHAFTNAGLKVLDLSAVTGMLAIRSEAFKYCQELTEITFPEKFTSSPQAFTLVYEPTQVTYLGGRKGYGYDTVPSCQASNGCTETIHGCRDKEKSNYDYLANVDSACVDSTPVRPESSSTSVVSKLVHFEVAVVDYPCSSGLTQSLGTRESQSSCARNCFANRPGGVWNNEYDSAVKLTGFQWTIPTGNSIFGQCTCILDKCEQGGQASEGVIGYNFILKEGISDTEDFKVLVSGKCEHEIYDENECRKALVDLQEVPSYDYIATGGAKPLAVGNSDVASCCNRGLKSYWTYFTNPNHCGPNTPSKKCTINYPCICRNEASSFGCTDPVACNYSPSASDDDGSCTYAAAHKDCSDACLNDTDGDGVCNENEVGGCTDPDADNPAPAATDDDGSCVYTSFCAGLKSDYKSKCGCEM